MESETALENADRGLVS